jgi:translation initiation factor IF-3
MNEQLITDLLRRSSIANATPHDVTVRVLVNESSRPDSISDDDSSSSDESSDNEDSMADEGTSMKNGSSLSSQLISLSDAIRQAVESDQDLVGIAVAQDIPVLRIIRASTLQHRQKNRKRREGTDPTASTREKEVRFKVGIASHDLQRKTDQLIQYLLKRHACKVTVNSPYRYVSADENVVPKMMEQILTAAQVAGLPNGGVSLNPKRTQATVKMQPISKK